MDPPDDEIILQIEKDLGYKLPASYIQLMKTHNGGIVNKNTCNDFMIEGIFGIGYEKPYSLCGKFGSRFWIEEWEYPPIGIAICDCPSAGHDMIFLDYRECGPQEEPCVVHIDQECDYQITKIADTFEDFINSLDYEDNTVIEKPKRLFTKIFKGNL